MCTHETAQATDAEPSMRLLQIISSLNPDFGGPPEGAVQICRALRARGIAADLATLDEPDAPWGCECGVFRLGPSRWGRYGYSDRLLNWLRWNRRKYDAVIVHGLWQYHGFAAWRALSGTGTPYYVFPHGMLDPWFKERYPLKHLKKQLYWPWAEHRVLSGAQAALFTSEEERQLARLSFERYRVTESVVGYGISAPDGDPDRQRAAFLQRFPHLRNTRNLLFLGRLHPKKGCDLLIDAFAKVAHRDPALHLVMAGPDKVNYQPELMSQAARLGLTSRITWTGMITGDLKWGAYHSSEAFVLPSHQENFGISVAEALACRIPVLISNKVNIWREIEAHRAGFVAKDTAQGTEELLHAWLGMEPAERELMGHNGAACFQKHFYIDSAADNLLNTIKTRACKPQHMFAA
jgi:glycosyltransferase involved in cell wall biosynthesis